MGTQHTKEMKAYHRLHDFLSDMIEGGRLTESDIPDDYQALVETLAVCANLQGQDVPVCEPRESKTIQVSGQAVISQEPDQKGSPRDPEVILKQIADLKKTLPAKIVHPHIKGAHYMGDPYHEFSATCPKCKRLSFVTMWQKKPETCKCGHNWGKRKK